jgi:predicted amidohydrolase YtcJ
VSTVPARQLATSVLASIALAVSLQSLYACQSSVDRAIPKPQTADLIISGGRILTLGEPGTVEAVAVCDGRVLAIGDLATVAELRDPVTVDYDLEGKVLAPAFVDHHVHLLNLGLALLHRTEPSLTFVDLSGFGTLEGIGDEIAKRATALPIGTWILGQGWSQGVWGAIQLPTNDVLNAAAPVDPVYLTRVDAHAGWANARAFAVAGIDAATPDPSGGRFIRDAGGEPSGVLLERANELLRPALPEPSPDEVRRAFRMAAEALAAQGVTEVFDAGFLGPPGIVDLSIDLEWYLSRLVEADSKAPLPLRIHLMIPAPSALAERVVADPERFRRLTPRIGVTHIKLFVDGALGSRGAFLSHPYADDPTTSGIPRMDDEEIRRWVLAALDAGFDVAAHAIGDAAVDTTLDVYEEILRERTHIPPTRLRIEHLSYARPGDFARAADLGILIVVNPDFVVPDDSGYTMAASRVGSEHSEHLYVLGRLAVAGARLAFGSDYFSAPGEPMLGFYCATTRQNRNGLPTNGWHPREKLSRIEALRIQTRLWPPGGGPPERGGLTVGGRADLAVLSADPLAVEVSAILGISVEATFLGGTITYAEVSDGISQWRPESRLPPPARRATRGSTEISRSEMGLRTAGREDRDEARIVVGDTVSGRPADPILVVGSRKRAPSFPARGHPSNP